MRKKLIIAGIISLVIISLLYIAWQSYDLSSDYNYATAKFDIKNGEVKIIHTGAPVISSKDKEIEQVAARYGFKNIYIEKFTPQQTEEGIKNYNELIRNYLIIRNGAGWEKNYQREIDSLYKAAGIEVKYPGR
ncbi:MAG TPA: hypothetical protein DCQ97_12120 [Chitinophagaceae bacterium]|nr:hypothetical protein [Chitinophagaceae bacterium]